jgi:Zn-dependent protease
LPVWVACAFVSILVHELGHVIAGRIFGEPSNIVLYSMGGLAIGQFGRLARWQRILVYAAGPAAGLLLFAFVQFGLPRLIDAYDFTLRINRWYFMLANRSRLLEGGEPVAGLPGFLIIQNLFWSLFNLIPIIPLDGGQIMRDIVTGVFRRNGLRLAFGLSFLLAGSIAVYSGLRMYRPDVPYPPLDPMFTAIMFAMFAMSNFSSMQSAAAHEKRSLYQEKDW